MNNNFVGTLIVPPIANLTAVTATTETGLWTVADWTAIHAYQAEPGMVWRLTAGGIMSFASTGTLIITPRIGTSTSGTSLGPNVNAQTTPGATTANAWYMTADLICRTKGTAGTNSTFMLWGMFCAGATGAAGTGVAFPFGGTSASADRTIETGLFIGWTLSVAGTVTPEYVNFQQVN